ncbi:hypothetical protein [Nonomuraea sp. NPDC049625]|uniref:hypothetical protein n=1 Tax=Nonomuraea sp. NPDC049625 TaxID=3155775 RepID=UPI003441EFE8
MAIHTPEMTATETVPAGTETAVAIPATAAPVVAPEGPGTAATDTDPATDADARMAAVWAALNAEPGASATLIGAAAGLSRMVAGKILNQIEADGRARREPGVNDGQTRGRAADRWYPITTDTAEASAPDAAPPISEVLDDGTPDVTPAEPTASDADTQDGDAEGAPDKEALPAADAADLPPADELTEEEALTGEEDSQPEGLSANGTTGEALDWADSESAPAPDADPSEVKPEPVTDDPAWARVRAELTELVDLFSGTIMAKDQGNAVMALGCLEMAMTKVASAHRNARAALTGTTAAPTRPAEARPGAASGAGAGDGVRPGALRDMVHAHLIEFPDKDFTPYEIGRALDRSSGAVANALDRLISLGDAVLTCERPRRFALAPTATPTDIAAEPGTPAEADKDEDTVGADAYGG